VRRLVYDKMISELNQRSLKEISKAIEKTSESADQASENILGIVKKTVAGSEMLEKMRTSLDELKESGDKITNIVEVVDKVAFQTNLLALNAAVEASKAGDVGKGFAVVASEVKNLARRTTDAVVDIQEVVDFNYSKIEGVATLSTKTMTFLQQFLKEIDIIAHIIGDIETRTTGLVSNITEIMYAVHNMDSGLQQNTALVEELASAADDLNQISKKLNKKLSKMTGNDSVSDSENQTERVENIVNNTEQDPKACSVSNDNKISESSDDFDDDFLEF